jgi:predicted RNA-binding Zn ribbon-like protein
MRNEASPSTAIPAAAQFLIDVVNSAEPQEHTDSWDSPKGLLTWLHQRRLLPPSGRVTASDLHRMVDVREGLRGVLPAHTGEPIDPAAVTRLNAALADVSLRARFGDDGTYRVSARSSGIEGVIGRILDAVRSSNEDGTWERVKVCARHPCRWAFYDASRNRSARWCSMAGCGNTVKMRRAYASRRQRATGEGQGFGTSVTSAQPVHPSV